MKCNRKAITVLQLMIAHLQSIIFNLQAGSAGFGRLENRPAFALLKITYESKGMITRAIGTENYNKIKVMVGKTIDSFSRVPGYDFYKSEKAVAIEFSSPRISIAEKNAIETEKLIKSML